jgi:O-antigen/teichoic acid export membrane protein
VSSEENLTTSAGRGAFFQVTGGGIQTVIRVGASTILARLLLPSDFGLFGMSLLIGELILRVGALGMGIGIIAKRNVSE